MISVRIRDRLDRNAELLFEQLLRAFELVTQPFVVVGTLGTLPQIRMRNAMTLNVDAGITHLAEFPPRERFSTGEPLTLHEVGVDEHRERVSEFLQNGPPHIETRTITVIDRDDATLLGNRFFAAAPREEILHPDDGEALIFERLHLLLELRRLDRQ